MPQKKLKAEGSTSGKPPKEPAKAGKDCYDSAQGSVADTGLTLLQGQVVHMRTARGDCLQCKLHEQSVVDSLHVPPSSALLDWKVANGKGVESADGDKGRWPVLVRFEGGVQLVADRGSELLDADGALAPGVQCRFARPSSPLNGLMCTVVCVDTQVRQPRLHRPFAMSLDAVRIRYTSFGEKTHAAFMSETLEELGKWKTA